ncbi:ABC transporter permease subunit [Nocardioides perillae]|uniref:Maltose/maltodextrin transport system permease protein n=1 Tax=Nocardioides perillae TaxID=1119534 RepID=A0A7Y9RYS5_9ACTN|nr:arabinogalactan oligomer/maltooligosaccharide transport system permease protein [Nocardioides perillae]
MALATPTGSTRPLPLLVKVLGLGTAVGVAAALTPTLLLQDQWFFLVGLWVIVALLVATYATGRALPAKYLLPGTLLLTLFVVVPIVMTVQTSFTNYGDGTRTSKEETVAQIVGSSVRQTPDAPRYNLTVGTTGSTTDGPFTFFLVDPETEAAFAGTPEGLEELDPDAVTLEGGFVRAADGYEILTGVQLNDAGPALQDFTVPTDDGTAIRQLGISQAFEGTTTLQYDEAADTITDTETGTVYTVQQQGDREYFVSPDGERVSDQSWTANVGFRNYVEILTDSRISSDFLRIFAWTVAFATLSVVTTFGLGLLLAVTLNDARLRGQKVYRALLIMPYAIPGFISLLLWASFYNRDFGLINDVTGLDVNWLGDATMAKVAVVITNLWMGFPYMFLVCTGALQAIPGDLQEAARLDGASGWDGFRRITFPLLLVTVAPLLVATFAFNFNNYNAIALLTEGGPYSPDNPTAGGTDILISYTIRLAFGAGGAQIGFASAVSVLLFVITGVIAALQFRATRALEDVN